MPPFKKYAQAKMVNWYHPKMLANIGLKAVVSGTFGNYADRRELEAALDVNMDTERLWKLLEKEYCEGKDDIWIDVINDTGDGFNSTFAVARTVAKKRLTLEWKEADGTTRQVETQRGKVLVFGGDEVYPFPTYEAYLNRFRVPFEAAAEDPKECDATENRPHMYAIPGNHDWYDGLGNFIKLFCQRRGIGIWSTQQTRSYFALPLPNRWWVWATDIQLNSDIDQPQLAYFKKIAQEQMQAGDTVILLTAEPAWVYAQMLKGDRSFDKLKFFVERYIQNAKDTTGRAFKLAATITGDLHHYSRYQKEGENHGHQFITAGGGGAFLHLTHNLPECLDALKEGHVHQQCTFPNRKESRRLLLWNFIFPFKNFLFTALLWGIYLAFYIIVHNARPEFFYELATSGRPLGESLAEAGKVLLRSPGILVICGVLAGGFYGFTDTKVSRKFTSLVGAIHGLSQLALLLATMFFVSCWAVGAPVPWWQKLYLVPLICALGAGCAATLFGAYLYCSNRFFDMHITEASSSLACEDYKNFVRLHVQKNSLTIYPIGIRRVPRHWTTEQSESHPDQIRFSGTEEPQAFLIEPPIQVFNDKL